MQVTLTIWLFLVISLAHSNIEDELPNAELTSVFENLRSHQYKHRCTRRFTPGICLQNNINIWMFDFQIMNCTERLGCPQSYRTNRFKSFQSCMTRCRPLVDLYLQILSYGGDNNDTQDILRTIPSKLRRNHTNHTIELPVPVFESSAPPDVEDYLGDEAVQAKAMYADSPAEMLGIDDVPVARDPHEYAYLHE